MVPGNAEDPAIEPEEEEEEEEPPDILNGAAP